MTGSVGPTVLLFLSLTLPDEPAVADPGPGCEVGALLGDPIAATLRISVDDRTFLRVRGGIWAWSFWHDLSYNTPYLAVDCGRLLGSSRRFHLGLGVAFFLADNPPDSRDYDAAVGVRLPIGYRILERTGLSVGIELAPFYQVAPAFSFKPYVIDLNGGLELSIPF
jgi:hypothetical protein